MARRSSAEVIEEEKPALHPSGSDHLVAHAAAEKHLLSLINAGRMPHALLLTGQQGIGKATLAYRLARFLLSPPEAAGDSLFGDALPPESLYIAPETSIFRRVSSGAHPDLLVLESDNIKVEEARKIPEFLSLTPAESKWRVVIVDSADAMNNNAANALLKTLEEPPAQAVLILISHNPGYLLPTIRSRCRTVRLSPLSEIDFAHVLVKAAPQLMPHENHIWSLLSNCSPGIALSLMDAKADALYKELIERIIAPDATKLHAFAERFARKDAEAQWQVLTRLLPWIFSRIAKQSSHAQPQEVFIGEKIALERLANAKPLDFWAELWEKSEKLILDTERLYLDRKQVILTLLRTAAE